MEFSKITISQSVQTVTWLIGEDIFLSHELLRAHWLTIASHDCIGKVPEEAHPCAWAKIRLPIDIFAN